MVIGAQFRSIGNIILKLKVAGAFGDSCIDRRTESLPKLSFDRSGLAEAAGALLLIGGVQTERIMR